MLIGWVGGILISIFPKMVRADYDECDECNILVGAAVAVCEEFAACRMIMFFGTVMFLVIIFFMCITGDKESRRNIWESLPSSRKMAGWTGGYFGTRQLLTKP